jgi:phosphatidylinositol glycan class B
MKTKYLLILGFILFIVAAICSDGYFHPDEHFQLLEFANYKMGGIQAEHLPWEFDEKMRPTFQVAIVYGLCSVMKMGGFFDPYTAVLILRLVTACLMFYVLYMFFNRYKIEIKTTQGVWWFAALSFLLWYIPFISVRYSSESFGIIFMLSALLCYDVPHHKKNGFIQQCLIGLLLGLSFISRFQMGFMIAGFGLWVLFIKKEKISAMAAMLLGFIGAVGLGLICDKWFYGEWVSSAYNYFYQNLVENKAAGFGVSPFWYYAALTPAIVFPLLGVILVPAFIYFFVKYPKHIFTWLLIPFLLIHHVIGHKEMRFLFAVTPFIPFVVVIMIEHLTWMKYLRFFKYVFWVINIPALLIMTIKPAYDNLGMFKYIYRHQPHAQVYYIKRTMPFMMYQFELAQKPFVKGEDLKLAFFHQPQFNPHPTDTLSTLIEVVKSSNEPIIFAARTPHYLEVYEQQLTQQNIEHKVLYHSYHTWLWPINYYHWINRDDVGAWTVLELSNK